FGGEILGLADGEQRVGHATAVPVQPRGPPHPCGHVDVIARCGPNTHGRFGEVSAMDAGHLCHLSGRSCVTVVCSNDSYLTVRRGEDTGQVRLDSYADAGVHVAIDLVNRLVVQQDGGERLDTLARILAVDPGSVKQVRDEHVPGFVALGEQLHSVVADLARGDDDAAATRLNAMLSAHPAHPHLAKEDGRWRMHHHPSDAPPVQMWTSICAEALGRLLAAGHGHRV